MNASQRPHLIFIHVSHECAQRPCNITLSMEYTMYVHFPLLFLLVVRSLWRDVALLVLNRDATPRTFDSIVDGAQCLHVYVIRVHLE